MEQIATLQNIPFPDSLVDAFLLNVVYRELGNRKREMYLH